VTFLVELLEAVSQLLGTDLRVFLLAWARILPVITLVPMFGLNAVAVPIRIVLGATMAAAIAPALAASGDDGTPLWFALLREAARGVPVALSTALFVWIAVMVGGLADNLRGGRESAELPLLEEAGSPFSVLLALLVSLAFLETGGAERLASLLAEPRLELTWAVAAERLAQSVSLAIAIATPLLAGSVLLELAGAFIARAASPAYVLPLLAPLRSLGVLLLVWVSLDRIVELLVLLAAGPL
jgi:type III secretory pathway component EscT